MKNKKKAEQSLQILDKNKTNKNKRFDLWEQLQEREPRFTCSFIPAFGTTRLASCSSSVYMSVMWHLTWRHINWLP